MRWTVPLTVAGIIAAGAVGIGQVDDQIRRRVEAYLASEYPGLVVAVQGAQLVENEGIVVRGISINDTNLPQQWRQILWIDELRLACGTTLAELASGMPHVTAIRVRRPVVHVVRKQDGAWNVERLFKGRSFRTMVPVSVEDGTLLIDDTRSKMRTSLRSVEIDLKPEIQLTAGGPWAQVQGSVSGDMFERTLFQGRVAPEKGAFELGGTVESLEISKKLIALIPQIPPQIGEPLEGLRGMVHLEWNVAGSIARFNESTVVVAGRLESGRYEHASLPGALSEVSAIFKADRSGSVVDSFQAHLGATSLRGSGRVTGWSKNADFDCELEAERLLVGRQWESLLPESLALQWQKLLPAGEVDLRVHLMRTAGRLDPEISVRCRNISITHYRFPYRVDRTVGTVVLHDNQLTLHLTGQAGGHAVHVDGIFQNPGPESQGYLEVRGEGMRIDDGLLAAMPPRSADIVRSMRASGLFDFAYRHERIPNGPVGGINSLGIRLAQCTMSYTGFPYPLSGVSGTIRMEEGRWTIKDVSGTNDSGAVHCSGVLDPGLGSAGMLTLHFTGSAMVLERELRDALPSGMQRVWDDIEPRGSADVVATVRHDIQQRTTAVDLEATPHAGTVSIEPSWFPYRLEHLDGRLVWRNGQLRFENVRGSHARTTVAAEGSCHFSKQGDWHVRFDSIAADRFRVDHDVLDALPARLKQAISAVRPRGLMSMAGTLDVYSTQQHQTGVPGPPAAAWDMQIDMEQGAMDVGVPLDHVHGGVRLVGQSDGIIWRSSGDIDFDSLMWKGVQVTNVRGPLAMDASGVRFGVAAANANDPKGPQRISGRLAGGSLLVDGRVESGDQGTFSVTAALEESDLERLAGEAIGSSQKYTGKVFGSIEINGTRAGTHALSGRGEMRLRDADLYELPLIVSTLKILRIKAPDRKAFSSSVIDFRIEGPHAYFDNIELSGDAISLVGMGEMDFDTNLNMTFRSIVGDSESQLPVMKKVLGGASGQFMLIHVDGTLSHPDMTSEAFPTLNAALQKLQSQRENSEGLRAAAAARRQR